MGACLCKSAAKDLGQEPERSSRGTPAAVVVANGGAKGGRKRHANGGGAVLDSRAGSGTSVTAPASQMDWPVKLAPAADLGADGLLHVVALLGSGGSGKTYLCREVATGRAVAVKVIRRPLPKVVLPLMRAEVVLQGALGQGHLNIVRLHSLALTRSHLALIMEYAAGNSLTHYVAERWEGALARGGAHCSEAEARYLMRQVISAVEYCHKHKVAHRDLKLDNTLLDSTGGAPRVKICDFGFARCWGIPAASTGNLVSANSASLGDLWDVPSDPNSHSTFTRGHGSVPSGLVEMMGAASNTQPGSTGGTDSSGDSATRERARGPSSSVLSNGGSEGACVGDEHLHTTVGTPVYMSPQLLVSRHNPSGYSGAKSDIWSCGVLLFVMVMGGFPFDHTLQLGPSDLKAYNQVWLQQVRSWRDTHPRAVKVVSASLADLLDRLLCYDEASRINLDGIKAHPWLNEPLEPAQEAAWQRLVAEQAELDEVMAGSAQDVHAKERNDALLAMLALSSQAGKPGDEPWQLPLSVGAPAEALAIPCPEWQVMAAALDKELEEAQRKRTCQGVKRVLSGNRRLSWPHTASP